MTTTIPEGSRPRHGAGTGGKPASGRPALFATMLALAGLGMLVLLVLGPALPIPVAVLTAAALMGIVALAWPVAGPRL